MDPDILMLFEKLPAALPLYEAALAMILNAFPDVKIKVSKTQVSFSNKHGFAYISLPVRKGKGWPEVCIVLTFGLEHRVEHARIAVATEPYPNRWTHHVVISSPEELDGQVMDWLREAYDFSMSKGRGRV